MLVGIVSVDCPPERWGTRGELASVGTREEIRATCRAFGKLNYGLLSQDPNDRVAVRPSCLEDGSYA